LRNFSNIQARIGIKNMDVKTMFQQFEDFGQSTITSEKLMGNISVNADINAKFNEKFQLKAPALNGQVQLKLKDGHLLDFEPIQRMGTYFRNRDFKDITFSEINQEFKINGTEMNIENLEIASSVLHLYIDGIYNFKGQTNLNLRVPLNNLKKRDKDYIPQNLGDEGRKAKALVLNAHGLPDKIKIGLGTHMHDTLK
ncbi:MAG TPA: AsmA-like C-terminal region-containing protein, partial [Bacteroidia bacterium]|nr:AsmA-like C-terminal region-containing protein [Bacteroidia bacterium]